MSSTSEQCDFPSIAIGSLQLRNNLIAAPLAGLSSLPYRLLAMEQGCALAISEMVAAKGVLQAQERTRRYFSNDAAVRPFGVQLFGNEAAAIAEAARIIADEPIDCIDINMGCPVPKVCKKGAGAALMKTPDLVRAIVAAVRAATRLPLMVKIRSGWDADSINAALIARIAQEEGADAVAVHGRTRMQGFSGTADWSVIAAVKTALSIPVIGNGDVRSRADALRLMQETACDGVMIGRAAVGNPWIFQQILDPDAAPPTLAERGAMALRHMNLLIDFLGEHYAVLQMRQMLPWYAKGIPGVKLFLRDLHTATTPAQIQAHIEAFFPIEDGSVVNNM